MAMGLINAANEKGIAIPHDISVMGYDDIHIVKYMSPSLTTVHQPKYRLGKAAVDALVARIGNSEHPPQIVELEPTVMARGSVSFKGDMS